MGAAAIFVYKIVFEGGEGGGGLPAHVCCGRAGTGNTAACLPAETQARRAGTSERDVNEASPIRLVGRRVARTACCG
jgi:hypothetical protein